MVNNLHPCCYFLSCLFVPLVFNPSPSIFCLLMKSTSYSVWSYQRFLFKQLLPRLRRAATIFTYLPVMLFKQETHRASQNRCHHTKAHQMMIILGLENCKRAMDIAEREFKIPQVLILSQLLNRHIVPTFKPKTSRKPSRCLNPNILLLLTWTSSVGWPTSPTSWRWPPSAWPWCWCLTWTLGGGQPWLLLNPQLGETPDPKCPHQQLQGEWWSSRTVILRWYMIIILYQCNLKTKHKQKQTNLMQIKQWRMVCVQSTQMGVTSQYPVPLHPQFDPSTPHKKSTSKKHTRPGNLIKPH